jgi:hypothetical protein
MKIYAYLFLAFCFITFSTGCEDDDDGSSFIEVPNTYAFERGNASTVSFSGQSTRIAMAEEVASAMKDFTKTEDDINNMFRNPDGVDPFASAALNAETKSVRSKVAVSEDLFSTNAVASAEVKADFDGWITAQVNDVFPNQGELAAPGQAGQIDDEGSVRYVNSRGLEYNQAFVKGLIGGLMYDQIVNNYLSTAVLDVNTSRADNDAKTTEPDKSYTYMEHRWDEAYGYLFGASADPTQGLEDLQSADSFLNKYVGRVENDTDYTGIATRIEAAFRTGRAAIVANDYDERNRQIGIIKDALSDVIFIRSIFYLKQGEAALRATPIRRGPAFHDLSEGYGFIYSLRFIPGLQTDPDAAGGYLEALNTSSLNGFWDINPDVLTNMANDIGLLGGIDVNEAGN